MTRVLVFLLVFVLAACADEPSPVAETPKEKPTLENCARLGGYVQRVGLLAREACVIPYKDAGKPCTDGSQCEGDCWAEPRQYPPGEKVTGACQPTNMPFGCHARVAGGEAGPALCVD
jgi:hypothetical protein